MSLIKWNGSSLMRPSKFFFDDLWTGRDFPWNSVTNGTTPPAVNVYETDEDFILEVAAPGLNKDSFTIKVENLTLFIRSEKEEKKEENEKMYTRMEYNFMGFERSFALPENVEADDIRAKYVEGILKVKLPKKEVTVTKSQSIPIK